VGFVFSVSMAAMAVSYIPGGVIADKFDRSRVMLFSWIAGTPSAILYYFARDYRMAALGIALYSGSLIGYPALNAYVQAYAPKGGSGSVFGIINAGFAAGMLASPLVAGYISEARGARPVFLISFLFFLAAVGVIALLPKEPNEYENPAAAEVRNHKAGANTYRGLVTNQRFMAFICCYSACAFGYYMIQPLISQYLSDVRSNSVGIVSMLGSVMSLGQVLITLLLGRMADRKGALLTVGGNMLVFVAALMCFVLLPGNSATVGSLFMLGGFMAGQGVAFAGVGETLQGRADGRAFGLFNLATSAVATAGPYLGGVLYSFSPIAPFFTAAAVIAAGGMSLVRQGTPGAAMAVHQAADALPEGRGVLRPRDGG
jgi:MFS family permease